MNKFTKIHFQRLKRGSAILTAAGFLSAPAVAETAAAETRIASADDGVSIFDFFKAAASYFFTDVKEEAYFTKDSWLYSRPYDGDDTRLSVSKYDTIQLTGKNDGEFWRVKRDKTEWYAKKADLTTDINVINKMRQEDLNREEDALLKATEAKEAAEKIMNKEAKANAKDKKQEEKEEDEAGKDKRDIILEKKQKEIEKLKKETKELQKRADKLDLPDAQESLDQVNQEIEEAEKVQAEAVEAQKISNSNADRGTKAVEIAKTKLGHKYVFGARGPDVFDCSGFTGWTYRHLGISLPRTAADQYNYVEHTVTPSVGDLVFFRDTYKPGISHVAIVIGDGMMIHAASHKQGLIISSYRSPYYSAHFAGFGKMPGGSGHSASQPSVQVQKDDKKQ